MRTSTVLFVILACFTLGFQSSDATESVDDDFSSLEGLIDSFVEIGAQSKAQQTTHEKAMHTAVSQYHRAFNVLLKRHPETAAEIGVVSLSRLRHLAKTKSKTVGGPDGYGEMDDILREVDNLASKIQGEQNEAITTINSVRVECTTKKDLYKSNISKAETRIQDNVFLITRAKQSIRDATRDKLESQRKEAEYSQVVEETERLLKTETDNYWVRRAKRDKERRVLKLALFLTCDFRAFLNHEYCVYLKTHKEEDVPSGCDIDISTQCRNKDPHVVKLKFEDKDYYSTTKADVNENECAQRAIYYFQICNNNIEEPVKATFRRNAISYTYPTQDFDMWKQNREKTIQKEDDEYNLQMSRTEADRQKEIQTRIEVQQAEDIRRQKEVASGGKFEDSDFAAKTELVQELSWSQKKIVARRSLNLDKFNELMAASISEKFYPIVKQIHELIQSGDLDKTDAEADEDLREERQTLVDLLKGLRGRLKFEQEQEDKDLLDLTEESERTIQSNLSNIRIEQKAQERFKQIIVDSETQVSLSTSIIVTAQKEVQENLAWLESLRIYCIDAENTYIVTKTVTDEELINVEKLRSVLRTLTTSTLPKCIGDCTNADQGYCQWKGRFGSESSCACEPEWYGEACEKRKCPGISSSILYRHNDNEVCTSRVNGSCSTDEKSLGQCICNDGFYHGPNKACEYQRCPGGVFDPRNDPTQEDSCSKHGTCQLTTGKCACTGRGIAEVWSGQACELRKCYSFVTRTLLPHSDPLSCGGNGRCDTASGKCECYKGYWGDNCDKKMCSGSCGNGTCNNEGTCACPQGSYGSNCQFLQCKESCTTDALGNTCNRNTGKCVCRKSSDGTAQYSGQNCALATREPEGPAASWGSKMTDPPEKYRANWMATFDSTGLSSCSFNRANSLIIGFWFGTCSWIYCLEQVICAVPMHNGVALQLVDCVARDWWSTFDVEGTSKCETNEFLWGLYRNSCQLLYCIEEAHCCKIRGYVTAGCYNYNWGTVSGTKWVGVDNSTHFLTGLTRSSSNYLQGLIGGTMCSFWLPPQ